jgi:SAM-dependent methyltransferase
VRPAACPCCESAAWQHAHEYRDRPDGETRFPLAAGTAYRRSLWRCAKCGHFVSDHDLDLGDLYAGDYAAATYGGREGIERSYQRIMALPPAQSDNAGRVERVIELAARHFAAREPLRVLDVGSGLGVFPGRLRERTNWKIAALEPDPGLAEHLREAVKVEVIEADYASAKPAARFDLITSNKVLEHVADPLAMLRRYREDLEAGGAVYLEVPDGEAAAQEGFHREEFFIEHHHVFSPASLAALCRRAGFSVLCSERLREPSTKYTLRAFLAGERA